MSAATKKKEHMQHFLIPQHVKLSDKEKQELLSNLKITTKELPKIDHSDPAVQHLDIKAGDVIKISRKSSTSGDAAYYRVVV